MKFTALREYINYLESIGELKRINVQVDPKLEITEIAIRALRNNMPALFFENVKGSKYPIAINLYASERRIEHALGKHPQQIGEELINFFENIIPLKTSFFWQKRNFLKRILSSRYKLVRKGLSQEIIKEPKLSELPIQICWPKDAGRFITQGQVITQHPLDGTRNIGLYRLQVYDDITTGMHWQIQKGGGFHFYQAEKLNKKFETAVALGTDPFLLIASISALPEGFDEVIFASFLRGESIQMIKGRTIDLHVPANAEFILEGKVKLNERRIEGPFGDHFGHYSNSAPFPIFQLSAITHRKNPIYPSTVVGIPPMEDKFLGDASQQILGPLVKIIHKEIKDTWAYFEAGFHNLLVVSVEERYQKEAMKAAFGMLGTGQLSLTKCIILVSHNINPKNWMEVVREIEDHFDPHFDFVLIPKVPLDTLDFTSYKMELGSKMILDATRKQKHSINQKICVEGQTKKILIEKIKRITNSDKRIIDSRLIMNSFLIVKVASNGRAVIENLVTRKELKQIKIIAAVSKDVEISKQESYIWGIFTRFDCERDVIFSNQKLIGISPIYEGIMGIDATWKKGYPEALKMDQKVVTLVDERWDSYWK